MSARFMERCRKAYPNLFNEVLHPHCQVKQGDKEAFLAIREFYTFTSTWVATAFALPNYGKPYIALLEKVRGKPRPSPPVEPYTQYLFDTGEKFERESKDVLYWQLFFAFGDDRFWLTDCGTYKTTVGGESIGASPDGLLFIQHTALGPIEAYSLEFKCHVTKDEVPHLPQHHYTQIQTQLLATGLASAIWIAGCGGGKDFKMARVDVSPDFAVSLELNTNFLMQAARNPSATHSQVRQIPPETRVAIINDYMDASVSRVIRAECLEKLFLNGFSLDSLFTVNDEA